QVTVLEATQQVGGRVRTFRAEDNSWYVELGAMRLPKTHRLVREFLRQFGLRLNPFIQSHPKAFYFLNGTRWRMQEVEQDPNLLNYPVEASERGKSAEQLYREAMEKASRTFQQEDCKSFLDKFDSFSTKEYLIKVGNLSRGAVELIGDLLNDDSGFYLSFLSSLFDFSIFSHPSFDEISGGFDQLPKAFQASLPGVVHLGCQVKEITTRGHHLQVLYHNSSEGREATAEADYVLVTSTARATRQIHFHPPLSRAKAHALRSVHYASSTKVALACRQRFWELDGIRGGQTITDRPSRFIYYPSHDFQGGLGVLLASYTWNDDSQFFAALPEERILELIFQDLADIHGRSKDELKELCPEHVVQKWELDQEAMGAFAAFTPYQFTDYSGLLFQEEGRLHFAGEHTAQPHAWIDTAMKAAIRAASNIHQHS
ncbi:OXLA oxidase, partial [Tricholaema leucomelas]|nr:OXLA oxidase [Tricholaema leucomelas]